ncbi:MAG: hypothetical protein GY708_22985 [Actinomycetia bacterium]|nr:hypothetical protein [Actinomycetes bacterium]MCP4961929.1 hypothetical protein [Actinomycetes bacterium]
MKRLVFIAACVATFAGTAAVTSIEDATAPQPEPGQLDTLGPITEIAHIYLDSIPALCVDDITVRTTAILIAAQFGVLFVPGTINIEYVDHDGGTPVEDNSFLDELLIDLNLNHQGCDVATSGAVAATISGSFANGDTFTVQVLFP